MKYTKQMNQVLIPELLDEFTCNPLQLINHAERDYAHKMRRVCDEVLEKHTNIILLTGPSSSGKTTSAKQIVAELEARGERVYRISLDNFYRPRKDLPYWSDGQVNYETIEALDIPYFRSKLAELVEKKTAEFPIYDFKVNQRMEKTFTVEYGPHCFIVMEGIHALNPLLCEHLIKDNIMRIYVSVHSDFVDTEGQILLRAKNLRLMRRLLRDQAHRSAGAEETLKLWEYVLRGERLYIKPFRQLADIHINSAHSYEPLLYAQDVIGLLDGLRADGEFGELAQTLIEASELFPHLSKSLIPPDSLIREFI